MLQKLLIHLPIIAVLISSVTAAEGDKRDAEWKKQMKLPAPWGDKEGGKGTDPDQYTKAALANERRAQAAPKEVRYHKDCEHCGASAPGPFDDIEHAQNCKLLG